MLLLLIAFGAWLMPAKAQTGNVCGTPIVVTSLPYSDAGNTSSYGNDYSASDVPPVAPGAVTNGTGSTSYLNGDDVVYAYTPSVDQGITISTTNDNSWIGLWAFTGCPFSSTVGYHTATSGTTRSIPGLTLTGGTTYYFVISTWPSPQSTAYTISITMDWISAFPCTGTPTVGTLPATVPVCSGSTTTLVPDGAELELDLTYLWEESADGTTWAAATGTNDEATYTTPPFSVSMYYRQVVTCDNSSESDTTNVAQTVELTTPPYYVYDGISYLQSFESWVDGCETTDMPSFNWSNTPAMGDSSWRRNDQGASAGWTTPNAGMYSPASTNGSYSARFHSVGAPFGSQGALDFYVDLTNNSGNSKLSFDYINPTSGTDQLRVHLSEDGGATFTPLAAALGQASSWTTVEYDIPSTSATAVIRFRATGANGSTDIGLDNVNLFEPCAGTPATATATADPATICAGGTSVITATGVGGEGGITLQWEQSNDGVSGWTPISGANSATYTTPALTVPRYFRVVVGCTYSGLSSTSNAAGVQIQLPTYAVYDNVSYTEGFEAWSNSCDSADVPGVSWRNIPFTGNPSWRRNDQGGAAAWTSTSGAYTPAFSQGAYSARFHTYNTPSASTGDLDLFIDMSAATGMTRLTMDVANTSGTDKLQVFLSTDGGLSFGQVGDEILLQATPTWNSHIVDFSSNSATTVIRLRATSDFGGTDIGVDNLQLAPAPSCIDPSDLAATSMGAFSWTASISNPSQGYEWEVRSSGAPGSGPTGLEDSGTTGAGVTNASASGLTLYQTYTVYVRASCGGGDYSVWTDGVTFTYGMSQIGTGASTNTNFPIYSCTAYNYTQQIYPAASYTAGQYITKIAFRYVSGSTNFATWSNWTVYMGNTGQSDFATTTSWIPRNEMEHVFSGTVTPVAGQWMEINLSPGFLWDGTSNIVVAVDENSPSTSCTASWSSFTSVTNSGMYRRITTDIDPADPGTATGRSGTLAQIQIFSGDMPSCMPPTGLTASNITATGADFAWTASITTPDGYAWEVRDGSTVIDNGSTTGTTANTTLLSPNTTYGLYVASVCGGDSSTWAGPYSFTTPCAAFTVPFQEGFNSTSNTESCWTVLNVNGDADSWDMNYTSNPYEGDQSAMMYTDFNAGANDDWLISPGLVLTGNERLRYQYRVQSSGEPNDMEVLLSTTGTNPADFTDTLVAFASYSNTAYAEQVVSLAAYTGTVHIAWHVPPGGLDGWRLYIDDVIVEAIPSCEPPTSLAASNITTNSANLSWWMSSSNPANGYEWEVRSSGNPGDPSPAASGSTASATDTTASASGLAGSTTYTLYVRANCGGTFSSWAVSGTFQTLCDVTPAPFSENFDAAISLPICWTNEGPGENWQFQVSGGSGPDYGVAGATDHTSGTGNFAWIDGSGNIGTNGLVTPDINLSALTTGYVSFWFLSNNTTDAAQNQIQLEVWNGVDYDTLLTYGGNDPNWIELSAIIPAGIPDTTHFRLVALPSTVGGSQFYNDLLVDDFSVTEAPACFAPTATAFTQGDCVNGQFYIRVNLTGLGDAPSVDIMSDYAGNPGGITGLTAAADTVIGPFPDLASVNVTVVHSGNSTCNLDLGPYTLDCSTYGLNALNFDGVNDQVDLGNPASLNINGNQITLEAWIYPTSWRTNSYEGNIINNEGNNTTGYMLRCGANGTLSFNLGDGGNWYEVISATNALTLNTWQHVAGTYDGSMMRIFINGIRTDSTAGSFNFLSSANGTEIGDWSNGSGRNFPGSIDEVRIWSIALSRDSIAAHMNTAYCGDESGLVGYYMFNQGIANGNNAAETTLTDLSQYGNDGTLSGFALTGPTSNWVPGVNPIGACIPVACPTPIGLTAANVTTTSVDLSWTNTAATNYNYEIRTSGAPGSGATGLAVGGTATSGSPAFTVSGLSANTTYSVYVQADCGGSGTSAWSPATSFSTPLLCGGVFTDTGGSGGDYGNSEDYTVTYCPDLPTNRVEATFTSFNTEANWDKLWVFNGSSTAAPKISSGNGPGSGAAPYGDGAWWGDLTSALPGPFIALNPSGCLTFAFHSDGSGVRAGWEANIDCAPIPVCSMPLNLGVSNLTPTSADLNWDSVATASSYDWELRTSGAPGSGATGLESSGNVTDTTVALTLTPGTAYTAYVRSSCAGPDSSSWASVAFSTSQIPVSTFPWNEPFTGGNGGFQTANGTQTNQWVWGSNAGNPAPALYISNNGTTATYTNTSTSVVQVYRDIQFPAGYPQISLSFDWLANGESCCDYLRVWLVPTSFTPVPGTQTTTTGTAPTGRIQLGGNMNAVTTWQTAQFTIPAVYAGTTSRLVFEWRNDGSVGTNPPGQVDNVGIVVSACAPPTALAVSNITPTSADFSWTASTSGPGTYDWEVRQGVTVIDNGTTASTTSNTVSLLANNAYSLYVRSNCGSEYSPWASVNFTTPCASVTAFVENFDAVTTPNLPSCWAKVGTSGSAYTQGSSANSTPNTLYMYGTSASARPTVALQPVSNLGAGTHWLRFNMRANITVGGVVEIGYLTDPNNAGTFQVLGSVTASTLTYEPYSFTPPAGSYSDHLAIRHTGSPANSLLIDDVVWEAVPSCMAATDLSVSNISTTGADLSWTASTSNPANGYEWEVRSSGAPGDPMPDASGNTAAGVTTASASGLAPNTTYTLYVRSDCAGTFSSWAASSTFNTLCDVITVFPFHESFENSSSSRTCWQVDDHVTGSANWTFSSGAGGGTITSAQTGSLNARFVSQSGTDNPVTKLVSPMMDLTGVVNPRVRFWMGQESWFGDQNTTRVYYRISSSDPWVEIANYTDNVAAWTEETVILPNPSSTYQIAFEGRNNFGRANVIDNVMVEPSPTCLVPTVLTLSSVGTTTAGFSWTASTSNPSNGYEWELRTSGAPGSGSTGLVASGTTAGTTASASGLTSSTAYSFHVRANCGGGDLSFWAGPLNFSTGAACGDPFYDTGGASANYGPSENWVKTYCATASGGQVRVLFNSFYTEASWDKLFVFNGPDTNAPKFASSNGAGSGNTSYGAGGWWGNMNGNLPGPFTSSNPSGCLTFAFVSDGSGQYAGWEAITQCLETNRNCANAFEVLCGGNYPGNTAGLAHSMPGDACAFNGPASTGGQNWWRYEGTGNNAVTFSTCSDAGFDTRISVFSGTACGSLGCVAMNDDYPGCANGGSSVTVNTTAGTMYWIVVHGPGNAGGSYTLSVSCGTPCTPPANDNCTSAQALANNLADGSNSPDTYTNACATGDAPTTCSGAMPVQGVWFTFNSGNYDHALLTLVDNGDDAQYSAGSLDYALYSGSCDGMGATGSVACVADASGLNVLNLTPNTDYTLLVYNTGSVGDAGSFGIMVEHPAHYDAAITDILNITPGQYCGSTMTPQVTLTNHGDLNLTAVEIVYGLSGGASHTYNWSGNLAYGQSVNVTLPTVPAEPGDNQTFTASVNLPNGQPDEITANDASSVEDLDVGGEGVRVVIHTDNDGAGTTWAIFTDDFGVYVQGGPYPGQDNTTIDEFHCLPITSGHLFRFAVMDGNGDGLCCVNGNGYWELRKPDGGLLLRDIFDANVDGFSSPSSTPAYPGYGLGHSFYLPAGPVNIHPDECGIFNNRADNKVYAIKQAGTNYLGQTLNYQFEFSNPDAGYIRRIKKPRNYVLFSELNPSPLTAGVAYFARVRTDKTVAIPNAHWGTGCEMGLGATVNCTQLIEAPAYGHSCNEVRRYGPSSFIYAQPVFGATQYEFRIYNTGEGYDETYVRNTYILELFGFANPLVDGYTYQVQVRAKVNDTWGSFCGSCAIVIDNSTQPGQSLVQVSGEATLWPNPVRDGQVNLNIEGITAADQHITVDVKDLYGQHVYGKEFENSGERFSTVLNLPGDIASGVYMVNITINGDVTTKRLSIVR